MKSINEFLEKNIYKIILAFLYLNPIMDAITGIVMNDFNINITLSSIIRLLFLIFCIYYLVVLDKTDNKKKFNNYLKAIAIYFTSFVVVTLIYKGFNPLVYEIKNALNTFYFPIVLMTFIDMFKQYDINIKLKSIVTIYFTYIILIIFPNVLGIGFLSYSHSKVGNVGFFISANAVGNILSILAPFIFIYILKNKKNILLNLIMILSTLYVFASMGTKVPIFSLGIMALFIILYYLIDWFKNKKYRNIIISMISIIVIALSSIIIIPKTAFYKNIQIHKNYLKIDHYSEVLTNYELIDHFIFSQRLSFLNDNNKNYIKSPIVEKLIGLGYIEEYATDNMSTKMVEMDYFDVFYCHGIIGFVIYFYVIIMILKESLKNIKDNNIMNVGFKISLLLIILLAFFSGHILITPAVSIFVAIIITLMDKRIV